ncbi:hypothetical protein SS05631_c16910 [Sinorhizobium sp. CCBAU 05631]|nr:hypothetical protein SS05631_c16910 [Sinorhizobium sp. CCBAU 05631]
MTAGCVDQPVRFVELMPFDRTHGVGNSHVALHQKRISAKNRRLH